MKAVSEYNTFLLGACVLDTYSPAINTALFRWVAWVGETLSRYLLHVLAGARMPQSPVLGLGDQHHLLEGRVVREGDLEKHGERVT